MKANERTESVAKMVVLPEESMFEGMAIPVDRIEDVHYLLDTADMNIMGPLRYAYLELCESINSLPRDEMEHADDLLAIQRCSLMLWSQLVMRVRRILRAKAQGDSPSVGATH